MNTVPSTGTQFAIATLLLAAVVVFLLLMRLHRLNEDIQDLKDEANRQRRLSAAPQQALAALRTLHDAVLNAATDAVIIIDSERRAVSMNGAARAVGLFQIGRSLIESTRSFELDEAVDETQRNKRELPRDFVMNGHLYRATVTAAGEGFVVVLRDISELTRLGRARRDFVANISHELRTPLTAIRLLLDALLGGNPPVSENQRKLLNQIGDQNNALTQMTQELSDLAQIESGQLPMRMVRANLAELTSGTLARLAPQAERAGLSLTQQLPPGLYVLVDPIQFQRVLLNLVHNAIKFTPRGSVTVSAERIEDDLTRIAVSDSGEGIASEDLSRIFERFYKVDRARGQSGTGLGLAIAKHIVEAHGGKIWANSTLGKGTTFYFTVPTEDE
jgi:two-component system phosphate regulon sensor histidine kinase PhoR